MSERTSATQLRRLSSWGQGTAIAGIVLVMGYGLYLALTPSEIARLLADSVPDMKVMPGLPHLSAAIIIALIPVAIYLYCLWLAQKLFGLIKRGRLYSDKGQSVLSSLGIMALVAAGAGVVCRTAALLLLTSSNAPGQRVLAISISSNEIVALIGSFLFYIFANVLREAAAIAKENSQFV